MDISDWLDRGGIALAQSANCKKQALSVVAETAARAFASPGLDAEAILDGLLARERLSSTGVGRGVGLPHARVAGLDRMRAVFVRLTQPVAFEAIDDQPVDLIFALFAPETAGSEHLRALACVSRLFREPDLRQQLRLARTVDVAYALLAREAEAHAA